MPKLFVASSSEGLDVARKLQEILCDTAICQVWTQDTFGEGKFLLPELLKCLDDCDFGVFVFTPDDTGTVKGQPASMPRDNVVLEYGMFLSRLGPERCFVVAQKSQTPLRLPTDLLGLLPIWYEFPKNRLHLGTALGPVCTRIREAIRSSLSSPGGHPSGWVFQLPGFYPLREMRPESDSESGKRLVAQVKNCRHHFVSFGLTRNFLASPQMLKALSERAKEIPVTLFMMDPWAEVRRHRYMVEPIEASFTDPARYRQEILLRFQQLSARLRKEVVRDGAGLRLFFFNFPCSFSMEWLDERMRVMLYGHNKRGTEGPTLEFQEGNPYYDFFRDQIEWLLELSQGVTEPFLSKGIRIRTLDEVLAWNAQGSGP